MENQRQGVALSVVRVAVVEVPLIKVAGVYNAGWGKLPWRHSFIAYRRRKAMTSIIICCDGTWNSADQETVDGDPCVTNVLKLACRVAKETAEGDRQVVYYDQGVGTGNKLDHYIGGAFGEGLEANIHDAYRFLIANYEPKDKLYIFGFSRGAYTARCIAGMVRRCGILRRDKVRSYPEAKQIYRNTKKATDPAAEEFRRQAAIEPDTPIQCIGVWDTVGALGIPIHVVGTRSKSDYEFLDTRLSRAVKFAFHALAVDEHRRPFEPTLWNETPPEPGQTVEQVWFAGAHSDVGGGYPKTGLSDHALLWMLASAKRAGLALDADVLKVLDTHEDHTQKETDSRTAFYKLQPKLQRAIGATPHKTEYFHKSLLQRWHDVHDYRPEPLEPHKARLDALAAAPLTEEIYPVA
jgi:uncharacterized protein (DUF2235 family)